MSQFTPAMDAALAAPAPFVFGAVEITLPEYNLRLLDGAATLTWGSKTFTGKDPIYGTLGALSDLTDGSGDEAPAISITLLASSDAAAADLASATYQGSKVAVYLGAVEPTTGVVVPDPELIFLGELDVPTLKSRRNQRELEYEVVSVFERFMDNDEGARLSDTFHRSVWPGELGLSFVTGVQDTVYWGMEGPPAAVTYLGGGKLGTFIAENGRPV